MEIDAVIQCERLIMRFGSFFSTSQTNVFRRLLLRYGKSMAFIKQEAIKGPDCQDFSMAVVKNDTLSLGDLVLRKTFHPSPIDKLGISPSGE
jgi:hypothetical protein